MFSYVPDMEIVPEMNFCHQQYVEYLHQNDQIQKPELSLVKIVDISRSFSTC